MSKSRPPYPAEFGTEAVRLARSSQQPLAQTARDLGVSYETLRAWVKQQELDAGVRTDGLTTEEREELSRLRREVRVLLQERESRVKASAFFAREIERTPERCAASCSGRRRAIRCGCCAVCWVAPPAASTPGAAVRRLRGRWRISSSWASSGRSTRPATASTVRHGCMRSCGKDSRSAVGGAGWSG